MIKGITIVVLASLGAFRCLGFVSPVRRSDRKLAAFMVFPNDGEDALAQALEAQSRSSSWWSTKESLPFDCTACGKCCKTKGSVWMTPDETVGAADYLTMDLDAFIATYGSNTLTNANGKTWVELTNNDRDACIFLDLDSNQCKIYPVRPVQCSTYPFWPDILESEQAWNSEVRLKDDEEESSTIPYWTPLGGGCEGMQQIQDDGVGVGVSIQEAQVKLEAYEWEDRRFPYHATMEPVEKNQDADLL